MAKVHPNATVATEPTTRAAADQEPEPPTVLTVWRKSLLFNCDGFTVYDARGDLAFRVDSYDASGSRHAEVVLMDATGIPLLTVHRKRLSLAERWLVYDGADAAASSSSEAFVVEGSYGRRAYAVRDARAEVRCKEAVGNDVFRLVVSPRLGAPLAMGLVITLDEMFGGRGSAHSWLRSAC